MKMLNVNSAKFALLKIVNCCCKWINVGRHYRLQIALSTVFILLFLILYYLDKLEYLPTTFFSTTTAIFSWFAYLFSKDRFRLDLLDRRWKVYENTLTFCSVVSQHGTLVPNDRNQEELIAAFKSAEESFRGIGYHKYRSLFGEDIHVLFKEINGYYAWLKAHGNPESDAPEDRKEWGEQRNKRLERNREIIDNLPDTFKPYVYFGDYKRHNFTLANL